MDDCSTDRTPEICAQYPEIETIRNETNKGKTWGMNIVLQRAATDLIMTVEADTILADDFIGKILPLFGNADVAVSSGVVLTKSVHTPTRVTDVSYLDAYGHGYEDMQRRVPDCTLARDLVGFTATRTLNEIIQAVIDDQNLGGNS